MNSTSTAILAAVMFSAAVSSQLASSGAVVYAADASIEQQQLVDKSRMTLESFASDASLKDALSELAPEAKAIYIVPQLLRGAFIFGGAGGSGSSSGR